MLMKSRFVFLLIGSSLLLNLIQGSWLIVHAHSEEHPPVAPSIAHGLDGNVAIHTIRTPSGEEVVQIIDTTRQVICYGKLSQGGASSISCQKSK